MTNSKRVQSYIDGVISGKIVAGKLVKAAVRRHLDDLEHGHERGLHFDPYYANRVLDFFPVLSHTTGEFAGEAFEPRLFQSFILWTLFGWRRVDRTRRYRWAYISLARGNGKSPFAAAVANYLLLADEPPEPRSQVYCFATKEAQARDIVFQEAKKQIESCDDPELKALVERHKSTMCILSPPWNGSVMEPKGSDSKKSDGWILHGGIIDELHEWHDTQRGLFEKIETSMAKRRQPLVAIITTAGDDDSTVWQEQYDFYRAIVEGVIQSDNHFAFIAEVDESAPCPKCDTSGCQYCDTLGTVPVDPVAEEWWHLWPQANPMLCEPRSPVKEDELKSLAIKARWMPSARNTFLRYYANQRVASFYKLITPELWKQGAGELPDMAGWQCHAGFDWGWKNDLAALSLVFPHEGQWFIRCWAWIPSECARDLHQEPWAGWIRDGWLTVTDGNTTDYEAIYKVTKEVIEQYQVLSMAADPNNCREYLTRCVNEWGLEAYEFFQTCKKYNEPVRTFVERLRKGLVRHGDNPLLSWCANNLTVREDPSEYVMPAKAKSADKIDPMCATIMAFSECMFSEAEGAWTEDEIGL